jgi:hypothetical protein
MTSHRLLALINHHAGVVAACARFALAGRPLYETK